MTRAAQVFVMAAGALVIVSILVILYAAAYLQSGHPPASGIVALIVALAVCPISTLAAIVGLTIKDTGSASRNKAIHVMTGINIAFTLICLFLFVFKVLLGRPI